MKTIHVTGLSDDDSTLEGFLSELGYEFEVGAGDPQPDVFRIDPTKSRRPQLQRALEQGCQTILCGSLADKLLCQYFAKQLGMGDDSVHIIIEDRSDAQFRD